MRGEVRRLYDVIKDVKISLLATFPYFGFPITRIKVFVDNDLDTLAATDGKNIYINGKLLHELSQTPSLELRYLLAHEALHIILMHTIRKPKNADDVLWCIATDIKVNHILWMYGLKPLSLSPIDPYDYWLNECGLTESFIRKASAEDIYYRLERCETLKEYVKTLKDRLYDKFLPPKGFDSLDLLPDDIKYDIFSFASSLAFEFTRIARDMGVESSDIERIIDDIYISPPKLPWQVLLRRTLLNLVPIGQTYRRLSRRGYVYDMALPSMNKWGARVVIAIDVSGSISDDLYRKFASEVLGLINRFRVKAIVLFFDEAIKKVINDVSKSRLFSTWRELTKRRGYGGTSFIPIFEWVKENMPYAKAIIVFTDGRGDYPKQKPIQPVVWVLGGDYPKSPNDKYYPRFGRVIMVE